MDIKKYTGIEAFAKYADEIGAKIKLEFFDTEVAGIYAVNITVGGTVPCGPMLFTYDKKRIFNFWPDYPDKLTKKQIKLFNKWNPVLAELKDYGGYPPENDKQAQDSEVKDVWDTRF